jgi:hypothetical protein
MSILLLTESALVFAIETARTLLLPQLRHGSSQHIARSPSGLKPATD